MKGVSVADFQFSTQLVSKFTDLTNESVIQKLVICLLKIHVYFKLFSNRASWVTIGGTTYKPGNIVVADASGLLPIFGQIDSIVFVSNSCHFVCEILITDTYNSHYHAYEVSHNLSHTPIIICQQSSFIDHHVLALYHISSLHLVPLKYHIPEYMS